jgi:CDP-paratose 2-epimerase
MLRGMSAVLITGGCGFIGANLAFALRAAGREVVAFDNLSRGGSEILRDRLRDHGVVFRHGDIRNPEDLARLPGDFSALIDASAEPSVLMGTDPRDARFVVHNNLVGTANCFDFALARRLPVVFLSTSRVVPYDALNALTYEETDTRFTPLADQPGLTGGAVGLEFPLHGGVRSLYGATKLSCELLLREYAHRYELPAIINRCGVIAGPWQLGKQDQGVFTHWLASHRFNRPLSYLGFGGTGKQVRDLLHVNDLVALVLRQLAVIDGYRGEVFPVGGGPEISLSLRETTALCRTLTGRTMDIGSVAETRPADVKWFATDARLTMDTFGWRPEKSAADVLADIHRWLDEHEPLFRALFLGGRG